MQTYDWDNDPEWQSKLASFEFVDPSAAERIIQKKKMQYYKQYIDPSFEIPETEQTNSSSRNRFQPNQQSNQNQSNQNQSNHQHQQNSNQQTQPQPASPNMMLSYIQLTGYLLSTVLSFVIGFTSFIASGVAASTFRLLIILEICLCLLAVYRLNGFPKLTKTWWMNVAKNDYAQRILYLFIIFSAFPSIIAVAPLLCHSLLFVSRALIQITQTRYPNLYGLLSPYLHALSNNGTKLCMLGASMEIWLGFMFIFQLFTAMRAFMVTIMYWQFLRLRYFLSPDSVVAWQQMRASTDKFFLSPSSPQFVSNLYQKLVNFLYSFVDPEKLVQQQQSGNSFCSIM